jgi:hypothetical protein
LHWDPNGGIVGEIWRGIELVAGSFSLEDQEFALMEAVRVKISTVFPELFLAGVKLAGGVVAIIGP